MNTQSITELVGLSSVNIKFKVHSKPLELDEGKFWGTCLNTGSGYVIEYCETSDLRQSLTTVLHELYHVVQFENSRDLSCRDADLWAEDMVDYILGEL